MRNLLPVILCMLLLGGQIARADRFADLSSQVQSLPATSPAEVIKQTVLRVAMERVESSRQAGMSDYADELQNDVEAALLKPADAFAVAHTDAKNLSVLMPLHSTAPNPYLDKLVATARDQLSKPEIPWPKATSKQKILNDLNGNYGSRAVASLMDDYFWLYAHPASPMRGNPELLARLLRRAHAYIDEINVWAETIRTDPRMAGQKKGVFDDFAIAPASGVFREFASLYPNMLLPSQKRQWDRAIEQAGKTIWLGAKDRNGTYTNIDVSVACELLNIGLYTQNKEYLDKAKFLIDSQYTYPDGAFRYIWTQNESATYHNTDTDYLARYYEITGYEKAAELLKNSQWYGPVSGRLVEFWTVPSWKETWNTSSGNFPGGEVVATLSGNRYTRAMLDHNLKVGRFDARRNVAWYRNDIAPAELPDHYLAQDRNIVGPRGWFGRFTYAASLRTFEPAEPGHATLIGAMITEPDYSLQSVLFGVYPRVRIGPSAMAADGSIERKNWAWITSQLRGQTTYARNASAFAATYKLHAFGSSQKGKEVDWHARQIWITLPDRIIGSLTLLPGDNGADAYELNGIVRFGTGGTMFGKPCDVITHSANSFSLNELNILVHHNDFEKPEIVKTTFRLPKAPAFELTLRDSTGTDGTRAKPRHYAAGSSWNYTVEIRPAWTKTDATVRAIQPAKGLDGLEVTVGEKQFVAVTNFAAQPISFETKTLNSPSEFSLHRNLEVATEKGKLLGAIEIVPNDVSLLIKSNEAVDHQAGFESYEQMVSVRSSPSSEAGK